MLVNRHLAHSVIAWTNALLLISLFVFAVSFFHCGKLPRPGEIRRELFQEPVQELISEARIEFPYRGRTYLVEPVATYEMWGLVVSHNDISAFTDIYHDKNSVDLKDLCLIWGSNVKGDNYLKVEFRSEPWSCEYRTTSREIDERFSGKELSNNHLLSMEEDVRKTIRGIEKGDQIYLAGKLVNYSSTEHPDFVRKTSTTRKDTGNGACEVLLVERAEVLKRGATVWDRLYAANKTLLVLLLVLKLLLFFFLPYEYTRRSDD